MDSKRITVSAFGLRLAPQVSNEAVFGRFVRFSKETSQFEGMTRIHFTSVDGDLIVGAIFSSSDASLLMMETGENGELVFKVKKSDELLAKQVEFNYFLISKRTGNGLFTYHRPSMSALQFARYMQRYYSVERESVIEALAAKQKNPRVNDIRASVAPQLEYQERLPPKTYQDLLDQMETAEECRIVATYEEVKKIVGQIPKVPDSVELVLKFTRATPESIWKYLAKLPKGLTPKSVSGSPKKGKARKTLDWDENYVSIDELGYEECVQKNDFRSDQLSKCLIIQKLESIYRKNKILINHSSDE